MKKLRKLQLNNVSPMSESEMKDIKGGVSREEYCQTLRDLWNSSSNSWDTGAVQGWYYGWSTYCQ